MPSSSEDWAKHAKMFEDVWNFPHCVGAIDGKHVMIQAPINTGSEYFNYKSFFSIVLFALVDAEYNFMFADVGCQGRISDGGVFKNSVLWQKITKNELHFPEPEALPGRQKLCPYVILGDEAFALHQNIMKPYAGVHPKGSMERIFNYRLSRARRVVENAFGILSVVFRVLRKPMLLEPPNTTLITLSTIYLHNYLRKSKASRQTYTPPGTFDHEEDGKLIPGSWRHEIDDGPSFMSLKKVPRKCSTDAQAIRKEIADYFMNNGRVPWQNDYA